jgi:hypothetical protein
MRPYPLFIRLFVFLFIALFFVNNVKAYILTSIEQTPNCALMEDINEDGMKDIIAAFDNATYIYYVSINSTGDLQLTPAKISTAKVKAIDVFDIDANGQVDIIEQDADTKVLYFLLNNNGVFSLHSEVNLPLARSIAAGMLNNDPYPDVVLGTSRGIDILWGINEEWYTLNNGSWFIKKSITNFGGSVSSLALKDLNSDGLLDIIVSTSDGRICVLIQQEDKSFSLQTYYSGANPSNINVVDVNYDNIFDVVVLYGSGINVFYGQITDNNFSLNTPVSISLDSYPASLSVIDFNKDDMMDMAVGMKNSNRIIYVVNQGTQSFVISNYNSLISSSCDFLWCKDFLSDGSDDVIYISNTDKSIAITEDITSNVLNNLPQPTPLELPTMTLSTTPQGSIDVNAENNIALQLTINPGDYSGTSAKLEISISNFNSGKTMYVTQTGLSDSEAFFWENWGISKVTNENIFKLSAFDLYQKMQTGHYSVTAILTFNDSTGTSHYISDTEEFFLVSDPIDYNNPPVLDVYAIKNNGYLDCYVNFNVPDGWEGLPADVYLWNQCVYTITKVEGNSTTVECCVYKQKFKSDFTWDMSVECQDISQGCPLGISEPFTSWSITDVTNAALFKFPLDVYPSGTGVSCSVNVKLVIKNWDGIDYTIWKEGAFNP